MRAGLVVNSAKDDTAEIAEVWHKCEAESAKVPQAEFNKKHAAFLRDVVCDAKESRQAIAKGIIRNWISESDAFSAQLARGLLGEDGKPCAATKELNKADIEKFRAAIAAEAAREAEPEPGPATAPSLRAAPTPSAATTAAPPAAAALAAPSAAPAPVAAPAAAATPAPAPYQALQK